MILSFTQTRGATPALPLASEVALEAAVTQDRATAMIGAAWVMAETFCSRNFYPVTAAALVAEPDAHLEIRWPRAPSPTTLTVERWQGGEWVGDETLWYQVDRLTECAPGARYRITQSGTVTPPAPGVHVLEAVRALALYALIQSPSRREFRQVQSGDSTLTREALGGLFAMSGAGAMLAPEVRW